MAEKSDREDLYISYNRYSTYKRCPAILGFWEAKPVRVIEDARNAVVGSCIHTLAEDYLKGKLELVDLYGQAPSVFSAFEQKKLIKWRGRSDRADVRRQVTQQVVHLEMGLKLYDLTPETTLAEVQRRVVYGELKLAGRIDAIRALSGGGSDFTDWKATHNPGYVNRKQMYIYFLIGDGLGIDPHRGRFWLTAFGYPIEVERDAELEAALLADLVDTAHRIQDRVFPFAPGTHCSFCDFRLICVGHQRYKVGAKKSKAEEADPRTGDIPWGEL